MESHFDLPGIMRWLLTGTGVVLWIAAAQLTNVAAQGLSPFYEDDFGGTAIDAAKWNTTIATAGERWCSTTTGNHHSDPGNWQDVATDPCHDLTQGSPYGAITVGSGQASFSAGSIPAFPYIWRGPPSRPSPFPSTGDFILQVRMKYDSIQGHGDGFVALLWGSTDPVGNNPPIPASQDVFFSIWAGTSIGLRTGTIGGAVSVSNPFAFHEYRLEYIDGKYSLFVDGVLKVGPTASTLRPNTIWIGNPVFTHWGASDWTDFTLDFVRVSIPVIPVEIDIKPGSFPNSINPKSMGKVPVAILSTGTFDAATVDPTTVRFGATGTEAAPVHSALEDVDGDGDTDMILHFNTQATGIQCGDTSASLTGETFGGQAIEGSDSINTVGCK